MGTTENGEPRRVRFPAAYLVAGAYPSVLDLSVLDRLDVLGARAFLAPALGEGHLLTFPQFAEADPLNARRVEEQVFFLARADETKTLVRQLFDRAFGHARVSRNSCLEG